MLNKLFLRTALLSLSLTWTVASHAQTVNTPKAAAKRAPNVTLPSAGFLEYYNRNVYGFNQGFDAMLFKPSAEVYDAILPAPIQKGISNAFSNLGEVPTVINDVLQGQFQQAMADTWRFVINTTVGIGGLIDVAEKTGLPPHHEDLGLTFAHWGWENSTYIVLPIIGPSTLRDAFGIPINYYFFTVYPHLNPQHLVWSLLVGQAISTRAGLLSLEDVREQAAFDPYVFEKNAYLQRRHFLIEEDTEHSDDTWIDEPIPIMPHTRHKPAPTAPKATS